MCFRLRKDGFKWYPLYRALERATMVFQLANTAGALERAGDILEEAGRKLEDCQMQVRLARPASNEPLPEEEKLLNVIDALQRIEHTIRERQETTAHQLKAVKMQFMIEVEQAKDAQDLNSNSDNSPVQPLRDLSSPTLYAM